MQFVLVSSYNILIIIAIVIFTKYGVLKIY